MTEVQRADLGPLSGGGGVIGAAEEPCFPVSALAPGERREAAVASPGLELRAVLPIVRQASKERDATVESGGMEVDRNAEGRVQRRPLAPRRHVRERLVLGGIGRRHPRGGIHSDSQSGRSTNPNVGGSGSRCAYRHASRNASRTTMCNLRGSTIVESK
jgi:hypothetical protein